MINLTPEYARLVIDAEEPFDQVAESMRMLIQLCRLNELDALVVSHQAPLEWRSSMRVALRFIAGRGSVPNIKLAFVVQASPDREIREAVLGVVEKTELHCAVFGTEAQATAWLKGWKATKEAN